MGVDVAMGSPFEVIIPVGHLNGAAGRVIPLNNLSWVSLAASEVVLTTTATAGSRGLVMQLRDANGNQLTNFTNGSLGPSTTATYPFGGGGQLESVVNQAVPGNQTIGMAAPWPILLPPGSNLFMNDASNIDPNDNISGVLIFTT